MRIGEVAKRSNIPASTIRYYERIGLINPPKRISGQRNYDESILEILQIVQIAKDVGFTLNEIRQVLNSYDSNQPLSNVWHTIARHKINEIENIIQQYQHIHQMLTQSTACNCTALADCMLVN